MAFLEANRYLYLTTPLGDDKLLMRSFEGRRGHEQTIQLRVGVAGREHH